MCSQLVRGVRFELTRPFGQQGLSLPRLPLRHSRIDLPHLTLTDFYWPVVLRLFLYGVLLHRGFVISLFLTGKTCFICSRPDSFKLLRFSLQIQVWSDRGLNPVPNNPVLLALRIRISAIRASLLVNCKHSGSSKRSSPCLKSQQQVFFPFRLLTDTPSWPYGFWCGRPLLLKLPWWILIESNYLPAVLLERHSTMLNTHKK